MKTIKLKTTIKCDGCIAKVTPFLNEAVGKDQWQVNTLDPSKILTVHSDQDPSKIIKAVQEAGFKAEEL